MAQSLLFFLHSSQLGGAERSLVDLTAALVSKGCRCAVVLPESGTAEAAFAKVNVQVIKAEFFLPPWAMGKCFAILQRYYFFRALNYFIKKLIPRIKEFSPDLIISWTVASPWGAIAANIMQKRHVLGVREYGKGFNFGFGYQESIRALLEDSTGVLAITGHTVDYLNQIANFTPDRRLVATVGGSVTVPAAYIKSAKNRPWMPHETYRLFLPGVFTHRKGHLEALSAMSELKKQGVLFELRMRGPVAEHSYMKKIHKQIKQLNLNDEVIVLPASENIFADILDSDVVLMCSVFEAMGRVTIETAKLSRPLVYADNSGPGEIFSVQTAYPYKTGNAKDLAKQIMSVFNNQEDTRKKINACLDMVNIKFNDEKYAATTLALLGAIPENASPCQGNVLALCERKVGKFKLIFRIMSSLERFFRKTYL